MASRNRTISVGDVCPVCHETIEILAIGRCDHPICFRCSTRMRILCEQIYCPICRTDLQQVLFVKKKQKFESIDCKSFCINRKYKIFSETEQIQDQYNEFLQNRCKICDNKVFQNFDTLKRHMSQDHNLFCCDLCLSLKLFSCERKFYDRRGLAEHKRHGDADDKSYKGHPNCVFCDVRYFDNDALNSHLRKDHYYCHFCEASGNNWEFFCQYSDLKAHFRQAHFLCEEGECANVEWSNAFRSEIDLKSHIATEHGKSMGKSQARQMRTLDVDFTFVPRQNGAGGRRDDQQRWRGNRENDGRGHGSYRGHEHGGRGRAGFHRGRDQDDRSRTENEAAQGIPLIDNSSADAFNGHRGREQEYDNRGLGASHQGREQEYDNRGHGASHQGREQEYDHRGRGGSNRGREHEYDHRGRGGASYRGREHDGRGRGGSHRGREHEERQRMEIETAQAISMSLAEVQRQGHVSIIDPILAENSRTLQTGSDSSSANNMNASFNVLSADFPNLRNAPKKNTEVQSVQPNLEANGTNKKPSEVSLRQPAETSNALQDSNSLARKVALMGGHSVKNGPMNDSEFPSLPGKAPVVKQTVNKKSAWNGKLSSAELDHPAMKPGKRLTTSAAGFHQSASTGNLSDFPQLQENKVENLPPGKWVVKKKGNNNDIVQDEGKEHDSFLRFDLKNKGKLKKTDDHKPGNKQETQDKTDDRPYEAVAKKAPVTSLADLATRLNPDREKTQVKIEAGSLVTEKSKSVVSSSNTPKSKKTKESMNEKAMKSKNAQVAGAKITESKTAKPTEMPINENVQLAKAGSSQDQKSSKNNETKAPLNESAMKSKKTELVEAKITESKTAKPTEMPIKENVQLAKAGSSQDQKSSKNNETKAPLNESAMKSKKTELVEAKITESKTAKPTKMPINENVQLAKAGSSQDQKSKNKKEIKTSKPIDDHKTVENKKLKEMKSTKELKTELPLNVEVKDPVSVCKIDEKRSKTSKNERFFDSSSASVKDKKSTASSACVDELPYPQNAWEDEICSDKNKIPLPNDAVDVDLNDFRSRLPVCEKSIEIKSSEPNYSLSLVESGNAPPRDGIVTIIDVDPVIALSSFNDFPELKTKPSTDLPSLFAKPFTYTDASDVVNSGFSHQTSSLPNSVTPQDLLETINDADHDLKTTCNKNITPQELLEDIESSDPVVSFSSHDFPALNSISSSGSSEGKLVGTWNKESSISSDVGLTTNVEFPALKSAQLSSSIDTPASSAHVVSSNVVSLADSVVASVNPVYVTKDSILSSSFVNYGILSSKPSTAPPGFQNVKAPPPGFETKFAKRPPPGFSAPIAVDTLPLLIPQSTLAENLISEKMAMLQSISLQFQLGMTDGKTCYRQCLDLIGDANFEKFFPQLMGMLPDTSKQLELLSVHTAESNQLKETSASSLGVH